MSNFYIKTTTGPKCHRGIQVSVTYSKNQGAFVADAYPYTYGPGQIVLINLSDILNTNRIVLAPSRANYAKQRKLLEVTIETLIKARQGLVWDLVLRVCDQFGLKPLPASKEIAQ